MKFPLYGPTFTEILRAKMRRENPDVGPISAPSEDMSVPLDEQSPLIMTLKRKRQAALLKDTLREGGYEDLAKMVRFHQERQ